MKSSSPNAQVSRVGTVVFYDGGCSLCRREIHHYERVDRAGRLKWVDINQDTALLNVLGVTYEQAMRQLHVLDHNGLLRVGVCAFAALWSELPYYRMLSRALYTSRSIRLLQPAYERFAAWRYRRRFGSTPCQASGLDECARG